jgi:predicted enzyme related to lactoylglutathione lyase
MSRRVVHCHVCALPLVSKGRTTTFGGKTVLEKVVYASMFVTDQDRALDFYTNVLGFEKRLENAATGGPRFLTVGLRDQDFQLVLWPGIPGRPEPVGDRIPAAYTIETGDCRKAVEVLESRGVTFATGILEFPWGYLAGFTDPDGNRLQLRELRQT